MSTVSVLVIGGGGGGGGNGGGGAGGYQYDATHAVIPHAYAVTIGAGGTAAAGQTAQGGDGGDSSFDTITAHGGGGGGAFSHTLLNGRNGASGGGGGEDATTPFLGGNGGTGTGGEGHNGGNGANAVPVGYGGGGGSSAVGSNGTSAPNGGNGGAGTANNISGSSVTYATGGGGGGNTGTGGTGNASTGGGHGQNFGGGGMTAGTANLGDGGGGGDNAAGSAGGSGVVIIRYPTGSFSATGGTITTSGSDTIHTFTSNGTFTVVAPPITADTTFGFSSSASVTAVNRFAAVTSFAVSTVAPLQARSRFTSDTDLTFSSSVNFTARSTTTITVTLNSVDISLFTVQREASISLGCNGTPDTAQVRVRGGASGVTSPQVGQRLTIEQGFSTLFDGEVVDVGLEQDYAAVTPFWRLNATDFSFLLKSRLITKTWDGIAADVIASDIITAAGNGFTGTNIQSGLPVTVFTAAFEDALSALSRLAQIVNASWRFNGKDLYFRGTSNLTSPATLTSSNSTFQKLRYNRRIVQAISRAIVEGGGTLGGSATVVTTGTPSSPTTIPLTQALGFSPSGYAILRLPLAGSYPAVEQTFLLSYSGVNNGAAVSAPSLSPSLSAIGSSPAGSVPQGQLYYACAYRTSAGVTGIGPVLGVFVASFPPDFPATGSVTLTLPAPSDNTVTEIDVYRSVKNGSSSFLFLAGTVTKPSFPASWANPTFFIDTSADNALGASPEAAGAVAPQGKTPPATDLSFFPGITGVASVSGGTLPAIPPGATVTVCAVVTDATKQSTLVSYEGTDGIREGFFQKSGEAVTVGLASDIATSVLAAIPVPAEEAQFFSTDAFCVPLASVPINVAGVGTTLVIQAVTIRWPVEKYTQRTVRASNQFQTLYQWLGQLNALLIKPSA